MQMIKFCIVFLGLSSALAQKQPIEDPSSVKQKLQEVAGATTSIKADFVEKKYLSYLKEPEVLKGSFYYEKESKLRWETTKPQNIFLLNGEETKWMENGKEKAGAGKQVVQKIQELMLRLVSGKLDEDGQFEPKFFENEEFYIVELHPKIKRLSKMYSFFELHFDKETLRLTHLHFIETSGDRDEILFKNATFNQDINDEVFTTF